MDSQLPPAPAQLSESSPPPFSPWRKVERVAAWSVTAWFLFMNWGARERQQQAVSEIHELKEEVRQLRAESARRGYTPPTPSPPAPERSVPKSQSSDPP